MAAIVAAGLLARLLIFSIVVDEPRSFYFAGDSYEYDQIAVNLRDHGVFSQDEAPPLQPDTKRTPTYPAMLAAVYFLAGHEPWAAILVQVVLGGLTAWLVFLLARELGLSRFVGLVAALVVALDPMSVISVARLMSETLFTALLIGGLWMLARFWHVGGLDWLLGAAVLLALMALTRPIGQYLAFALLPLFPLALTRTRPRVALTCGLLFVAVSSLITYAWAVRNEVRTDMFTVSTIGTTNLLYWRAAAVRADVEGMNEATVRLQLQEEMDRREAVEGWSTAERFAAERREATKILQHHPVQTGLMLAEGAVLLLLEPGYSTACALIDHAADDQKASKCWPGASRIPRLLMDDASPLVQALVALSIVAMVITYALAAAGSWILWCSRRWLPLALLVGICAYFVLLSAGPETNARLRLPFVPCLAILAGVGAEWAWGAYRARCIRRQADHRAPLAVCDAPERQLR